MPQSKKRYRPNVAVIVVDRHGRILACERSDYPGCWQIPQGGIEAGENVRSAALRELQEEIGTCSGKFLGQLATPIRYEWPKKRWREGYCGQDQRYFLFRLSPWAKIDPGRAHRKDPSMRKEFRRTAFMPLEQFFERAHGFKIEAYRHAVKKFESRFPGIFQHTGSSQ